MIEDNKPHRDRYKESLEEQELAAQPATGVVLGVGLSGLVALFGLGFGLDTWFQSLQATVVDLFVIITYVLASLLFATAGLALFWFLVMRARRQVWVTGVYLVVGLLALAYPLLHLLTQLGALFPTLINVIMPGSHVYYAAGFIAAIGLLSLTLPEN